MLPFQSHGTEDPYAAQSLVIELLPQKKYLLYSSTKYRGEMENQGK